jgi:hypothetical protein
MLFVEPFSNAALEASEPQRAIAAIVSQDELHAARAESTRSVEQQNRRAIDHAQSYGRWSIGADAAHSAIRSGCRM